jgi:agmatinase
MKFSSAEIQSANPGQIALLGVPWDEQSSFLRGAAQAPPLIRAALFSEASGLCSETGKDLEGAFFDADDLPPLSGAAMMEAIEQNVTTLLERGLRPLVFGGDHAITYPILKAFHRAYPRLTILHFDAHPDLYDSFAGNRYSHACPFARIMEEGLAERLVQLGIRTLNSHQRAQAERFGVEIVEMKDWRDGCLFAFDTPVYISFDLDGLDPAFAPGVSHHEPGGLSTRQAIDTILRLQANVVGADIVEYNPLRDVANITAAACAKLAKEIAGRLLDETPEHH